MSKKIWLSSPHMGELEKTYVDDVFASNWIAPLGAYVDGFENDLAEYTGTAHAAALSSGTAAIHLALILSGVGQGDEVICQSFTFSASANPIVYQGAKPVFVDSERDTWNMCPVQLRRALEDRLRLGKKVKAIIPVHLYGMPAKIEEIISISEAFGIPVIEDAAEALGSRLNGKACGSFGRFGVLSFNGNKIITTSGGGALLGDDVDSIARSRFLATQARDPAPHYEHSAIGYNYRLSNVLAAIGRGQMKVLDERISLRRRNYDFYFSRLASIPGISFLQEPEGCFSNRWLTTIMIDESRTGWSCTDLRLALEARQIESRPVWKPMHLQPVFSESPYYGEGIAEELFNRSLCLPSGSNLGMEDLETITDVIRGLK